MRNFSKHINWIILPVLAITLPDMGKLPGDAALDSRGSEKAMVEKVFPDKKKVICKYETRNEDCRKCSRQICSDGKTDWESNLWTCNSDACVTFETSPHNKEKWEDEDKEKAFEAKGKQ